MIRNSLISIKSWMINKYLQGVINQSINWKALIIGRRWRRDKPRVQEATNDTCKVTSNLMEDRSIHISKVRHRQHRNASYYNQYIKRTAIYNLQRSRIVRLVIKIHLWGPRKRLIAYLHRNKESLMKYRIKLIKKLHLDSKLREDLHQEWRIHRNFYMNQILHTVNKFVPLISWRTTQAMKAPRNSMKIPTARKWKQLKVNKDQNSVIRRTWGIQNQE